MKEEQYKAFEDLKEKPSFALMLKFLDFTNHSKSTLM
jgi:hypothetical protein